MLLVTFKTNKLCVLQGSIFACDVQFSGYMAKLLSLFSDVELLHEV
jgi:hypothetical protein